jgi:electron transport complex protein RnfG
MSENATIAPQKDISAGSFKMLRAMVGIGVLCALLIVLMYEGTKPRIARLKAEALQAAIFKVLPGISESQGFVLDQNGKFNPLEGKGDNNQVIYAGYDADGQLTGLAIEASGQGYADIIRILYGYDPVNEKVIGFYVLESKETPGLGDKIEKDEVFLSNFNGLDVSLNQSRNDLYNEVVAVKSGEKEHDWQVDGITGATISSRAIADIIDNSAGQMAPLIQENLEVFEKNRQ